MNRSPTRTRSRTIALLIALVLVCAAQLALASTSSAKLWKVPDPDLTVDPLTHMTEYENRVVHFVNLERTSADLKPVRYFNGCIDQLSERWARKIADTGELVHRDLRRVLRRCDLSWAGETLVRGTALSPADAVEAWMQSPSHRDVLMKKRARHAGLGAKIDSEGRLVGVLNFGDPA